jgi:microcystin-dependent protein
VKNLELLIPQKYVAPDVWRWATVTAIGPLRIRLDGESEPLDITPDNTIGPVSVGTRVWTQTNGRRILVIGAANGPETEPVGVVKMYAGSATAPPPGYLFLNGSTFSSTDFPQLAALLGDKYATHIGTSYYLPDLRGRVVVGLDSGQAEFSTVGKWGGFKTHTLSVNEIPPHAHDFEGQTFSWGAGGGNVFVPVNATGGAASNNYLYTWQNSGGWTTTYNQGGGAAHNNLQPYLTMNYIICAR